MCTVTYTSSNCIPRDRSAHRTGCLKSMKRFWQRFGELVLMLAAAGLSAALVFVIYTVFVAID